MFAVVVIPDFSLQARLRSDPSAWSRPIALLTEAHSRKDPKDRTKFRITQLTEPARKAGVATGMSPPQAQARCPDLELCTPSPPREQAAQEALLQWAATTSPSIEATADGICTLSLKGTSHAPGREQPLGRSCCEAFRSLNLAVRVGMAATPELALLAARLADPIRIIPPDPSRIRAFLDPLPVESWVGAPETQSLLKRWGIHTLGALMSLPREEVAQRLKGLKDDEGLEDEVLSLWEWSSQPTPRPLKVYRPSPIITESIAFEGLVERLDELLQPIRQLLEQIACRLTCLYQVADQITLQLHFDDDSAHVQTFSIPEPTRDPRSLQRMLHTYLENFRSDSPITGLSLTARPARPSSKQLDLFDGDLRDPNRLAETLARLGALVGTDRVGTPQLEPTHRPDAFRMRAFLSTNPDEKPAAASGKNSSEAPTTADCLRLPSGLPLRRFRPPLPVEVTGYHSPSDDGADDESDNRTNDSYQLARIASRQVTGRLRRVNGPWRLSGEWWTDHPWDREEWDIELENGGLYRLVLEAGKWHLDGVYG